MKIATTVLAGLLLIGTVGINAAKAADGVIEKDNLDTSSYCHMKFAAIESGTVGTQNPVLSNANTGNVIDYYGPCDENPLGKDQQTEQRLNQERHGNDVNSGY